MIDRTFQVGCPSCETLFEVTDPTLIGQIVACPKCGGMMMIEPPKGRDDDSLPKEAEAPTTNEPAAEKKSDERVWRPVASTQNENLDGVPAITRRSEQVVEEKTIAPDELAREETPVDVPKKRRVFLLAGLVCLLGVAALAIVLLGRSASPDQGAPVAANQEPDASEPLVSDEDALETTSNAALETASNDKADVPDEVFDVFQNDEEFGALDGSVETKDAETENADDENVADDQDGEIGVDSIDAAATDDEIGATEETEVASDAETESEDSLDEDPIPTDFDEAEFERKNQTAEEEKNETDEEDLGSVASTTDVPSQNLLPTLKNRPTEIDVDARMTLPIHSIVFPESPAAAARLLSEFSGVPVEFDLERFPLLRPSLNKRLDLKLDDVDVGTALAKEAEMLKWNLVKTSDRILIEPQSSELSEVVEQRFDVADILGDATPFPVEVDVDSSTGESETASSSALVNFVKSLAAPGQWGEEGEGKIVVDGGELVVTHNSTVRKSVEILLDQLRVLRRLDAERQSAAKSLAPELHGWETLSKKTSFNLIKPISIQQATSVLESKFNFLAIWDDAELNAAGVGRDSTTSARIEASPVAKVLSDVLEPFRLNYVILDEKLILITTNEKADSYQTVEFHGFATLDSPKTLEEALKLTKEMTSDVAPESWSEPERSVWIDVENGCWIVRQSQPVQRRIRAWTSELLKNEKTKETRKSDEKSGDSEPSKD